MKRDLKMLNNKKLIACMIRWDSLPSFYTRRVSAPRPDMLYFFRKWVTLVHVNMFISGQIVYIIINYNHLICWLFFNNFPRWFCWHYDDESSCSIIRQQNLSWFGIWYNRALYGMIWCWEFNYYWEELGLWRASFPEFHASRGDTPNSGQLALHRP